jgi:hypothetical protein
MLPVEAFYQESRRECCLNNDRDLYFETLGKLPNRTYTGCWINHFFPVETPKGKVQQVGVLAVEVTELRALDDLCTNLTSQVHRDATEEQSALLSHPHGCNGEYKTALGLNLASIRNSARPGENCRVDHAFRAAARPAYRGAQFSNRARGWTTWVAVLTGLCFLLIESFLLHATGRSSNYGNPGGCIVPRQLSLSRRSSQGPAAQN